MPYSYTQPVADGVTRQWSLPFPYIDKSHVAVKVNGASQTITWLNSSTVQIPTAPSVGQTIDIRRTTPRNTATVTFNNGSVENEYDLNNANLQNFYIMQELIDDQENTLRRDSADLKWDAKSKIIKNLTDPSAAQDAATKAYVDTQDDATEAAVAASAAAAAASASAASTSASNASTSASNASTSASNASTSASNASGSASAAAGSATAAANTLASALWRDVVFKTFADSPITIAQTDNGKLIVIDTAGGNVVVNMPQISGLTLPFSVGIKKDSTDASTITINRAGTDTIDGSASKTVSAQGGAQMLADTGPTPDRWSTTDFGLSGGTLSVYEVTGNGTLATYDTGYTPGSENNTWVSINGVVQRKSSYSFSGSSITLAANLPNGAVLEVVVGTTLAIGVPADGSVTLQKLDAGVIPPGVVWPYAGDVAPAGWLMAAGGAVSRTTFAALFAVCGTKFGAGDGSTTFGLPDMRGRTLIGAGQGIGLTNRTIGSSGGEESHILTSGEVPAVGVNVSLRDTVSGSMSSTSFACSGSTDANPNHSNQIGQTTGGGGSHNNMQPWLASNFIIKT